MAELHSAVSVSGTWRCVCWLTFPLSGLTRTLGLNRAIVIVTTNICAFVKLLRVKKSAVKKAYCEFLQYNMQYHTKLALF